MKRYFLNILVAVHWRNQVHGIYLGPEVCDYQVLVGALHTDTNCVVIQVVSNLDRFTLHSQLLSEGSSRARDSDSATKCSLIFYCTRRLVIVFTSYFSTIHFNINHTVQVPYHSVTVNSFCPTIVHIYVS